MGGFVIVNNWKLNMHRIFPSPDNYNNMAGLIKTYQ
jgi:hypothetical protein